MMTTATSSLAYRAQQIRSLFPPTPERLTTTNKCRRANKTILRRIHSTSCPPWPTKDPDSQPLFSLFGYHKSTNERSSQNSRARNDHENA
jgi:hypothetical protein